ncbi:FMN-binding negative transcriptional regulator [Sulfitobacter donghicola]|uniref:Negative transcriptional regulator n=1 Tax=Sulfitobacter donghicola DSW-25 = KCTC 12864 = JCM 14565 TaxID=1300350 RepID=A0A073IKA4_9RHOB|nr:FMN-binding negative transcriptional regulator [Sulfitobacter donghicola]KEJ90758.1 negative transcriptional regulator [Sulfitobacter donghicola DSW-25 = KCTC 12864 = JCM 14565]KIN68016.1 Negative transcriptional regulator [Sulfitobacter donghicola DSW-25 = KCTC 12864 = JCM 14565]
MHPNPIFHDVDKARNIAFARQRAFGVLAVNGEEGPSISHVPFLLNEDASTAELHLVRSNPIARMGEGPLPAKIVVSGSDSYVSPDWYGLPDQVPTWNYIAVHLTGQLEKLSQEKLRDVLDRLSENFEKQLLPKPPWAAAKMTPEALEKMMRMIVPFRFTVTGVDGTWKLGQNKVEQARVDAAGQMAEKGIGTEVAALAEMMRNLDHR